MDGRGRKSIASLSVLPVVATRMLAPPDGMPTEQAALWAAVVATKPQDWFQADSIPLLTAYVQACDAHRVVAAEIDAYETEWLKTDEGLRRYDLLLKMQDRQSKLMSSLATKMRLTQQSRYGARAAETEARRVTDSRPWERQVAES